MPLIRVDFDDEKVNKQDVFALAEGIQKIVSEATGIEDVFVYANASQIKIKISPVEIFIEMSAQKIVDQDKLILDIKSRLSNWKEMNKFQWPINLTLIPMQWKIEIGI
ncbi:MAG: hypothetical protein KGJ89_04870 [Patescibacteria group bacterium]|nr:hypothetical protein [Patescibacteria group bacterium]MDE2015549.1 hypothetical protein [Patescibacteria group bacterium]MDE2227255.1 hypothetical protein [Patescibacteria group bacterium]